MKALSRIAAILTLPFCAAICSAQGPDGAVKTINGGKSTPITSLSTPLTFSSCSGTPSADVAFDCALFGGAQQIFAGINETGYAWNTLSLTLTGYSSMADPTVNCDGDGIFTSCSVIKSGSNLTIDFSQGTGTGVECDWTVNNCIGNSIAAFLNDLNPSNPVLPYNSLVGCGPRGAVCGPDELVIGVGTAGDAFNVDLALNAGLGADGAVPPSPVPEPSPLALVGAALIALLLLGIRKASLV